MDLTAHLPLMRHNQLQAERLFRDDRVVLALGCRTLIAALVSLRPREQIVGVATSETASLGVVERLRPDVVMVSDPLEDGCGFTLVTTLKERWPALRVRAERVALTGLRQRVRLVLRLEAAIWSWQTANRWSSSAIV